MSASWSSIRTSCWHPPTNKKGASNTFHKQTSTLFMKKVKTFACSLLLYGKQVETCQPYLDLYTSLWVHWYYKRFLIVMQGKILGFFTFYWFLKLITSFDDNLKQQPQSISKSTSSNQLNPSKILLCSYMNQHLCLMQNNCFFYKHILAL